MLETKIVRSGDGTPIATWHAGSGTPLLMIHGMVSDHDSAMLMRETLEAHYELWTMDRRGRGMSGDSDAYALQREVEDVLAVARAIGKPAYIFGQSFGALLTLGSLLAPGQHFRKAVLYEAPIQLLSAPMLPAGFLQYGDELLARGEREELVIQFAKQVVRIPDKDIAAMRSLPTWPKRVAAAHTIPREARAIVEYRCEVERLRALTQGMQVLVGENSAPSFQQSATFLADALQAKLVMLEGQGHVANVTAPALLARQLIDFYGS